MKRFCHILLVLTILLAATALTAAKADSYGTLNQKMATRTGPSTKYDEPGTFFSGKWKGQWVRVISKVNTGVWWLQVEFDYNGQKMRAYTGLKRVNGVDLDAVPTETVLGSCRLSKPVKGYYGPGTQYRVMGYSVPANTTCDVIMVENGYVLVEFPYHKKNYEKSRAWVHASLVSGDYDDDQAYDPSDVREGTSWWSEEPEWSSCELSYISADSMSIHLFFYRIADIYGVVTLDSINHGKLDAWFDYAPNRHITGDIWFHTEGVSIYMDAYEVSRRINGGSSSFYNTMNFYYEYK